MTETKKIGLLTSGGDCAGLNAVLRAVVHRAVEGYGWEVYGIEQRYLTQLETLRSIVVILIAFAVTQLFHHLSWGV